MSKAFHLLAILKKNRIQREVFHLPIHATLQESLPVLWRRYHGQFLENIEEVPFNIGYKPEDNERFVIPNFKLPNWIVEAMRDDTSSAREIGEDDLERITGLFSAMEFNGEERILFQNFSRSHVIRPQHAMIILEKTYQDAEGPIVAMEPRISAVYVRDEEKLLFRSFRNVNSFLPLSDYYRDASEGQIRELLNHDIFVPEDVDGIARNATQWEAKQFAILADSGNINRVTVREACEKATDLNVGIRIKGGRIVFPEDRKEVKKILLFLNERVFRGSITDTVFETNSKKPAK